MSSSTKAVLFLGIESGTLASVRRALAVAGPERYEVLCDREPATGLRTIERRTINVVLLELTHGGERCLQPLCDILAKAPELPVIVLSRVNDPELATEAVRLGAQDYLVMGHINEAVIRRVVRYAVERNKILRRVRALDDLKSRFVSTVSHEIRTPLAIIREFVSLVHDEVVGPANAEQKECLTSALRNCDRLTTLVNDLLDLSRIESNGMTIRREPTDLVPLLERSIDDFRPRATAKQQRLTLSCDGPRPMVLSDSDRIQQVLVNLLGNAHKFTQSGGQITVSARVDGRFVRIGVRDDGPGIGPADLHRIFEAFTQVNRNDESSATGTGLGLAISKSIVELHDGSIEVDSAPGAGSTFEFTLPLYRDGAELEAFFRDRLRNYDPRSSRLSFVLVRPRSETRVDSRALDAFQQCAGNVLRNRRDETLLVPSRSLVVCMLESDMPGSIVALERIAAAQEPLGGSHRGLEFALLDPERAQRWQERAEWDGLEFQPLDSVVGSTATRRVLVVDDGATTTRFRGLLGNGLPRMKLLSARSGYEACVLFGRFRPELVILDLRVPDLGDGDVLASFAAAGESQSKFVALCEPDGDTERLRELGYDVCLTAPFTNTDLIEAIRRLLPEVATADEPIAETV